MAAAIFGLPAGIAALVAVSLLTPSPSPTAQALQARITGSG